MTPIETLGQTQLLDAFRLKKVRAGETLSTPMDPENCIFYLREGRLRLSLCYGEKRLTLALLKPGDIYCTHTRAYVDALEASEIGICPLKRFSALMIEHPALSGQVMRVLASSMNSYIDTIENLAFRDVKARFACFLLGQHNHQSDPNTPLDLGLTIEQLAQIIGTSRQTLSSLMNQMESDQVIERRQRGQFLIRDLATLKQIASL